MADAGGKVIILEEASRLDACVFTEVIAPLIGVSDVCLIGISTPLAEDNFYSELIRATDEVTGRRVFLSLEIKLICDACNEKGVRDACAHTDETLPPWKMDQRRGDIVKRLITDKDTYVREHLGIITELQGGVFEKDSLQRFYEESVPTHHFRNVSRCFVCVDTAGGGASSMAIVGAVYNETGPGMLTVVSANASRVDNNADMSKLLTSHFRGLRSMRGMSDMPVVLLVEANFGGYCFAHNVYELASKAAGPPITAMSADSSGKRRVGVHTTAETKEKGRQELDTLLSSDKIRFADIFWAENVPEMRKEIVDQLRRFRYVHKCAKDVFTKDARILTGKTSSKSDDLAMALQMICVWSTRYLHSMGELL